MIERSVRSPDEPRPAAVREVLLQRAGWIALASGAVAGVLVGSRGLSPTTAVLVVVLALAGPVLSAVDLALHRLPDGIVLPCAVLVPVLLALTSPPGHHIDATVRAELAGALSGLVLGLLAACRPGELGWGDVKLSAGVIGPLLGWFGWMTLACGGLVAFGCAALVSMALRRTRGAARLPLGPFLFAGALAAVLIGRR